MGVVLPLTLQLNSRLGRASAGALCLFASFVAGSLVASVVLLSVGSSDRAPVHAVITPLVLLPSTHSTLPQC